MELINEFDFEINHIKGKDNGVIDALNKSMHTIYMEKVSKRKNDIKYMIKDVLWDDEYFQNNRGIFREIL